MGTKSDIAIAIVADKETGERKAAIGSDDAGMMLIFSLEELKAMRKGVDDAIAYIEKHGTHTTESVPEGAVRH